MRSFSAERDIESKGGFKGTIGGKPHSCTMKQLLGDSGK